MNATAALVEVVLLAGPETIVVSGAVESTGAGTNVTISSGRFVLYSRL